MPRHRRADEMPEGKTTWDLKHRKYAVNELLNLIKWCEALNLAVKSTTLDLYIKNALCAIREIQKDLIEAKMLPVDMPEIKSLWDI